MAIGIALPERAATGAARGPEYTVGESARTLARCQGRRGGPTTMGGHLMKRVLSACAAAALAVTLLGGGPATAQKKEQPQKKQQPFKAPEGVEVLRDVEYGRGGGRALKMHILRPAQLPRGA